jgi:hypothetical protein
MENKPVESFSIGFLDFSTQGDSVTIDGTSITYDTNLYYSTLNDSTDFEKDEITMKDLQVCSIWTKSVSNDIRSSGGLNAYRNHIRFLISEGLSVNNHYMTTSSVNITISDPTMYGFITYNPYDK